MIVDYRKIELFGKSFIQKIVLKPPFEFTFPVAEQACFLYMLKGEMQYRSNDDHLHIPANHSLLLNCIASGKQIRDFNSNDGEIVIVTFHPDILKKVYESEIPSVFKSDYQITNQSRGKINNDFLIRKYIEGLLFYFENPSLINDEILILKLKEIILLLSQTRDAETIRVILSQLFSPTVYTFKQIIEANIFAQAGIEQLAEKMNLSASTFKREFKRNSIMIPLLIISKTSDWRGLRSCLRLQTNAYPILPLRADLTTWLTLVKASAINSGQHQATID